ncbi:hypothetical protein EDB84DRAFT_1462383 [Lactarius hengduanensis]|nr:hypothetical protein EDB84DRAFT_1462383 [Lactarius hengduanensis]
MSRTHHRSLTPLSQHSVASSSRFREHLSIAMPPPDPAIERSHFSPVSLTGPSEPDSTLGGSTMHGSSRSRPLDPEKGLTGHSSMPSTSSSIKDRFTRLFLDLRAGLRDGNPSAADLAPPPPDVAHMPEWRPLNVRKQPPQCVCHSQPPPPTRVQRLRDRALLAALAVLLLYLFINVTVLNVRSFSSSSQLPAAAAVAAPPASAPTTTDALPADTQQCISQYTLNAPSNPTGYPCGTCLPLLAALPPSATAVYPAALDATQFCGLRSLWEDAGQQGQAGLEAGGWVKDVKFCTWAGVRCDGAGRVSSLQLTFPAVPASLPAEFTNLTALENLEIIGDGNSPAGGFPEPFGALTALAALHLENTALGPLPDTLQNITSLTLVRNAQVGSSLPPSISDSGLRFLVVNHEPLTLSAAQSAALCGGQLQNCDLRGSGVQACGACLVG